ncbi:MAG: hypothetical protein ABEH43_04445, partial [Flavobacteriales bacterium]
QEALMFFNEGSDEVVVSKDNAGVALNALWALGLSNKNSILEEGPMVDPRYGGASVFASTGGWTLSEGNSMNHYSAYDLIPLTSKQQVIVERVSKNIFRPCCNNSTYFPDCNHGMAMLGFLELMAANGLSESDMYNMALELNSLWFPGNYQTIGQYFENQGIDFNSVSARKILGAEYSSASGYARVLRSVNPVNSKGASCGV